MAFVKTMMSVFGFLRFIPASRFFANAGETVTDLSSASVMGRQVLEDTISFFYLSEPNLPPQEKCLRKLVWEFHGKSEHIDSGRLAWPHFQMWNDYRSGPNANAYAKR